MKLKTIQNLQNQAGFPTYYVRIAPHAMLTLIAQARVFGLEGVWGLRLMA